MKLLDLIKFSADFMSPGAALAPTARNNAVETKKKLEADASPSDLASHHTWQEPSASDVTIKNWQRKRVVERIKGRNLDPFEMMAARPFR